jgi:type I restriction enzyme, R subunit
MTVNARTAARQLRRQQTPAEARLWQALRRHQLDGLQFRRQHPIGMYVADFYCPAVRLIVEVDGSIHRDPDQQARDRYRDAVLSEMNLTILRVTNDDVLGNLAETLRRIRAAAKAT